MHPVVVVLMTQSYERDLGRKGEMPSCRFFGVDQVFVASAFEPRMSISLLCLVPVSLFKVLLSFP